MVEEQIHNPSPISPKAGYKLLKPPFLFTLRLSLKPGDLRINLCETCGARLYVTYFPSLNGSTKASIQLYAAPPPTSVDGLKKSRNYDHLVLHETDSI
ncbi:hypothetical protein HZ326_12503 [Fusarium oxysporum f. sp. albedinis]|nr:hypothetical protein HZ326_12503 [Fusarium oxysporum f. sp. albedinis]